MTIDWTKPIETTDGMPARVLATDVRDIDTTVGVRACVLVDYGRHELPILTRSDGTNDLLVPLIRNKRTKREGWVNVWSDDSCGPAIYPTRQCADDAARTATHKRVDCRPFTWEA